MSAFFWQNLDAALLFFLSQHTCWPASPGHSGSLYHTCFPRNTPVPGQVVDDFIALADRTMGREDLILGSCQLSFMVGDLKVPASLFNLTVSTLFENQAEVEEAMAAKESEEDRLRKRCLAICRFFKRGPEKRLAVRFFRSSTKSNMIYVALSAAGGSQKVFSQRKRCRHFGKGIL